LPIAIKRLNIQHDSNVGHIPAEQVSKEMRIVLAEAARSSELAVAAEEDDPHDLIKKRLKLSRAGKAQHWITGEDLSLALIYLQSLSQVSLLMLLMTGLDPNMQRTWSQEPQNLDENTAPGDMHKNAHIRRLERQIQELLERIADLETHNAKLEATLSTLCTPIRPAVCEATGSQVDVLRELGQSNCEPQAACISMDQQPQEVQVHEWTRISQLEDTNAKLPNQLGPLSEANNNHDEQVKIAGHRGNQEKDESGLQRCVGGVVQSTSHIGSHELPTRLQHDLRFQHEEQLNAFQELKNQTCDRGQKARCAPVMQHDRNRAVSFTRAHGNVKHGAQECHEDSSCLDTEAEMSNFSVATQPHQLQVSSCNLDFHAVHSAQDVESQTIMHVAPTKDVECQVESLKSTTQPEDPFMEHAQHVEWQHEESQSQLPKLKCYTSHNEVPTACSSLTGESSGCKDFEHEWSNEQEPQQHQEFEHTSQFAGSKLKQHNDMLESRIQHAAQLQHDIDKRFEEFQAAHHNRMAKLQQQYAESLEIDERTLTLCPTPVCSSI